MRALFLLRKERSMSQRKIEIKVRLNRKGSRGAESAGPEKPPVREAISRHLIDGAVPRSAAPGLRHDAGAVPHRQQLNQVAQKAHTLNVVDVQRYDAGVRQLEAAIKKITEAVILPQPMEQTEAPHSRGTLRERIPTER